MSRAKNPKYESMSLEELRANMEKSKKELEHAIHNKNILEQRKRIVERKERSHRLIVKGAEFEKAFPLSRDLEQEEVQDMSYGELCHDGPLLPVAGLRPEIGRAHV